VKRWTICRVGWKLAARELNETLRAERNGGRAERPGSRLDDPLGHGKRNDLRQRSCRGKFRELRTSSRNYNRRAARRALGSRGNASEGADKRRARAREEQDKAIGHEHPNKRASKRAPAPPCGRAGPCVGKQVSPLPFGLRIHCDSAAFSILFSGIISRLLEIWTGRLRRLASPDLTSEASEQWRAAGTHTKRTANARSALIGEARGKMQSYRRCLVRRGAKL
jgi:hypothetical protein